MIIRLATAGCHQFLTTLVGLLTWQEAAFVSEIADIPLLHYASFADAQSCLNRSLPSSRAKSIDWKFLRSLSPQQTWNEKVIFTALNLLPLNSRKFLLPSVPLAEICHSGLSSAGRVSGLALKTVEFNPKHPILALVFENEHQKWCLSVHCYRTELPRLGDLLLHKSFDYFSNLTVSWSPGGTYLMAKIYEGLQESSITFFKYSARSGHLVQSPLPVLRFESHWVSSDTWLSDSRLLLPRCQATLVSDSELDSDENLECTRKNSQDLWVHRIDRSGTRLTLFRPKTDAPTKSTSELGFSKTLGNKFWCQTSFCNGSNTNSKSLLSEAHSIIHFRRSACKKRADFSLHLPGLLLDVCGQNDAAFVLWKSLSGISWISSEPVIADYREYCSNEKTSKSTCALDQFSIQKTGGAKQKQKIKGYLESRVYLSELNLLTKKLIRQSAVADTLITPGLRVGSHSSLLEDLCNDQPRLKLTDHLIAISARDCCLISDHTLLIHRRHHLEVQPLSLQQTHFFHPSKNVFAKGSTYSGFPVTIFADLFRTPDFEPATCNKLLKSLKSKSVEINIKN